MALVENGPLMQIEDFKAYYDLTNRLYVALFDCISCSYKIDPEHDSEERFTNQEQNSYDPSSNYTDGFIMQAILQYTTPDIDNDEALLRGLCVENETLGGIKSCFGF